MSYLTQSRYHSPCGVCVQGAVFGGGSAVPCLGLQNSDVDPAKKHLCMNLCLQRVCWNVYFWVAHTTSQLKQQPIRRNLIGSTNSQWLTTHKCQMKRGIKLGTTKLTDISRFLCILAPLCHFSSLSCSHCATWSLEKTQIFDLDPKNTKMQLCESRRANHVAMFLFCLKEKLPLKYFLALFFWVFRECLMLSSPKK